MAVRKRYKRRLLRGQRIFYWYVKHDDEDADKLKIYILSEDKKLIAAYELGQANGHKKPPFLTVMGREFAGLYRKSGDYIRVRTPLWEDAIATPSLVGKMIDWCLSEEKEIVPVDYNGDPN